MFNINADLSNGENVSIEQKLRDEAAFVQAIVRTVVDGVLTIDAQGIVRSFNPAAERMFGYQADEVIGKRSIC